MPYILLMLVLVPLSVSATQPVTIAYRDKPPYFYTLNGEPKGFLKDRFQAIFNRAGVPVSFDNIPMKRMLADIYNNKGRICSAGSYKLKEREQFAKFSLVVHKDNPHVVLISSRVTASGTQYQSLHSLLRDPNFKLGAVTNVSYGTELDSMIDELGYTVTRVASSTQQLAKMVSRGHGADVMFLDREDYTYLDAQGELAALGLQILELADMPPGLERHLMCSQSVDNQTMAQLNQAILELLPDLNHRINGVIQPEFR